MSIVARCPSCGSFYPDEGPCPREGTVLEPSDGVVDRYRIVSRLGQGSMGVVYRAQHTMIARTVAIKLLYRELARDPRTVNRFFREARAATAVESPHIVEVSDFGLTKDGDAFLVMELLEGTSLRDLLNLEHMLPIARACTIALDIAAGLHAAHSKGIVHRDLKPENVLLVPGEGKEQVKLLDFGIAQLSEFQEVRLTEAGIVLGTPAYMSPEQAAGERLDQRTDIYSLGTILYEMLTGHCPFDGENAKELLVRKLTQGYTPPRELRPEIPVALEAVVLLALERKPDRRASTMLELMQELRDAMVTPGTGPISPVVPVPAEQRPGALPVPEEEPLPEPGYSVPRFELSPVRRMLPIAGIGLGLVLGIVLTLLITRSGSKNEPEGKARRDMGARVTAKPDAGGNTVVRRIEVPPQTDPLPDPRIDRRRKYPIAVRPVKTKRVAEVQPGSKRHSSAPTASKYMATLTSTPPRAEVYDEEERIVGRTPMQLPTDKARTVTLHRVGSESATLKIPAHSTGTFHGKLKASTMSWEVLSLTQLKQMLEKGQISKFTYNRRRTELLRKRDEKLFDLKIKLKLREITQEQFDRQAKSIKDSYK